jgi:hypothetical protein
VTASSGGKHVPGVLRDAFGTSGRWVRQGFTGIRLSRLVTDCGAGCRRGLRQNAPWDMRHGFAAAACLIEVRALH